MSNGPYKWNAVFEPAVYVQFKNRQAVRHKTGIIQSQFHQRYTDAVYNLNKRLAVEIRWPKLPAAVTSPDQYSGYHCHHQSPHSDYVTRCYFNICLQQGSRDDRVSRDVFSFLYV